MKKLLLVAVLAMTCLFANAQDDLQGKWFVGGALGYSSDDSSIADKKDKSFEIMPMVGTFISSDVAVGARLGYSNDKINKQIGYDYDEGEAIYGTEKTNKFVIEPFARKYWTIAGGLKFFGEASLPVSFGSVKVGDAKTNETAIGLALAPGFEYFINSWISVDTKFSIFNVDYTSSKPKGGESTTSFDINGNTHKNEIGTLTIGVKFLF